MTGASLILAAISVPSESRTGLGTTSIKDQIGNIFDSVANAQLCHCSAEASIDST